MPLYESSPHPGDTTKKTKTEKADRYPIATFSLIWFFSPLWGAFIAGWLVVLSLWPDHYSVGQWWMIGITYAISWLAAWITRWYYEDTYAPNKGVNEVITGW